VFDPAIVIFDALLKVFWESHNPTQGMRQGNDIGTQYRSGIYCYNEDQLTVAKTSLNQFQKKLSDAGFSSITTEIIMAPAFYYAEDYHQQYLAKNPDGYCGLGEPAFFASLLVSLFSSSSLQSGLVFAYVSSVCCTIDIFVLKISVTF
ncbi:MAG: peptide-methionine (S)-S-oxide reductase MsrA, partial [Gammaproteobacteria bacterium]|nr:peptide-methionine (S)-S-oxide reductase MsrA [Gammaproteobacteria bacterium]